MGAREECIEIKNSTELLQFWSPQNICKRSIVDENKIESFEKKCKNMFHFHILCYSSRIPNFEVNEYDAS